MPPPSVKPAMPVLPTTPPVVARPCTWVSRLSSFHNTPPWARTVRGPRVDVNTLHRATESISRPRSSVRVSGDIVAAAAYGDIEAKRSCKPHRVDHIGDSLAAGDRGRTLVDQAVVYPPPDVIARIVRLYQFSTERP